ncbi:hypothetical protein MGWOODY_Mmi1495 [hydrothermal vent metagenome]|uniref:Uncharacterized protein n=1 Tax=hydrothermal vent metagenome TaxID=652676 RepID=A0A170QCH1_9ZZZZ
MYHTKRLKDHYSIIYVEYYFSGCTDITCTKTDPYLGISKSQITT